MPQFVRNGPFVPDRLVQDLEDDRVVIFCGAGISVGAGLPTYRDLVAHCFAELGQAAPSARHRDWDWPDRLLGFLESRTSAAQVREVVAERLSRAPQTLEMHKAILALAQLRQANGIRLITTNFDLYFERADTNFQLGRDFHVGPILPIPRNDHSSSWKSLVYLHGRLDGALNNGLILTSADFGRAYLTDAWAARFVARLFADFTVLFIGYSLADPVLRYMTDAFAAEDAEARFARDRGPAYIFTPYDASHPQNQQAFIDRKLEPIFYHSERRHRLLKATLVAWAEARSDYLANTATLIQQIARFHPAAIGPTDTANLLWAIFGRTDPHGHGARTFADFGRVVGTDEADQPPPIEWLDVFESREREASEAQCKAEAAAREADRPGPPVPTLPVDRLFPVLDEHRNTVLPAQSRNLIPWLVRHLGTEGLVDRVIEKTRKGRRLHPQLRHAVRERLRAEPALPEGVERFWRLLASEGVWTFRHDAEHPARVAASSVTRDPDPAWLKLEIQSALRPVLTLDQSLARRYREADPDRDDYGERFRDVADVEVALADEAHLDGLIAAVDQLADADAFWGDRVDDVTCALAAVLDLFAATDQASLANDPSAMQRPSILPHEQNHAHEPWTRLFDLLWRGWMSVDARDASLSRQHVARWRRTPYLAFRRLSLAAMAHSDHFSDAERLELLADD